MKQTSPKTRFLLLAFIITMVALAGILGFIQAYQLSMPLPVLILVLIAVIFTMVYGTGYIILGQYISQGANGILGHLQQSRKKQQVPQRLNLNEDVFQRLKEAIQLWAREKDQKIDKLKESENYRREFVGNVSHELKTPIFNIQGYIHTLLDGGLEDKEINHKYLEKAVKNIERLSAIVEDLEAISQLETGALKLSPERFDLSRLANDVIESMEIGAREKEITLRMGKNVSGSVMAKGDIGRIRQVLTNLVTNSIKYGRKSGETVIRLNSEDRQIRVEVSDDGIGISKEHLPRLFERFYRVDKSRSRDQGGTGLGLSIVKHILEAHGKSIEVDSEPEKGTTFHFSLDKP